MDKCPICKNSEINQKDNYCKICGYKLETQKFVEFIKDDQGVTAKILSEDEQIIDVLVGVSIILGIVKEQTGKEIDEIIEIVKEIYKECGGNENASK